jgi:hypothetical protein
VHYDDTLRRVWHVAFFLSPLAESAMRKAFCTADTLMASRDSPIARESERVRSFQLSPVTQSVPPKIEIEGFKMYHH